MNPSEPIIVVADQNTLLNDLRKRLPGYVPAWLPGDFSAGSALMRTFARYLDVFAKGLNQVPGRSHMAFLDMLGVQLLPAQAARVPLVFTLTENAPVDMTLPRGSQVAASASLKPPSARTSNREPQTTSENIFATTQTVTLCRSRIAALYSIDPRSDEFAGHTAKLTDGFTLFDDLQRTEHAIYLGHNQFFALGGEDIVVMLSFSIESQIAHELKTQWEYLTEGGWSPLQSAAEDDTTDGMRHDGLIMLRRDCAPKAKQDVIEGQTSYWLRGRLITPILPDGTKGERTVPTINDIRARIGFTKKGIAPEAAFADGVPLDISKEFYPFGQQPATYATFYLACKEVFQRKGARVRMEVAMSEAGGPQSGTNSFELDWEFFDGSNWSSLGVQSSTAKTFKFDVTQSTTLSFECPQNWSETSVNGQQNYWLRVRITDGDYGKPVSLDFPSGNNSVDPNAIKIKPSTLRPPVVSKIELTFTYLTDPFELDHCLSVNGFVFEDHTEDCRWPDRTFQPFRPVEDVQPAVHFNFDRRLPAGLVSMYVNIPQEIIEENTQGSPFLWEYRSSRGWTELGVFDETNGFRQSGMIQFIGPPDAVSALGLGGRLFHVRARLMQGQLPKPSPVGRIWLNAVWAEQRSAPREEREELGISDGNPGQTFSLRCTPVLEGEVIEIQEWTGRGESWQNSVLDVSEEDLRFEREPGTNVTTAVWVTWHPQVHLYNSAGNERHYSIERANGLIRFGNGHHGLIPSSGNRIIAAYSSGGNADGNVPAGAITELHTALPFIQSVTNPVPASVGTNIESRENVKRRGPQHLRHRDRAVSVEDCGWLAREASPDVARVRCLQITGPAGHAQRGWITLVIAPHSSDPQPQPSPEFRRRVRAHLAARVPAAVSRHVRIVPPQYIPVSVRAEIIPIEPGAAAQVEASVRNRLNQFLHPLTGGSDGLGWDFGQVVYLSQIAQIIEETPGVDYASDIRLSANDQSFADFVPIDTYALVAAGDHELKLTIGGK